MLPLTFSFALYTKQNNFSILLDTLDMLVVINFDVYKLFFGYIL